MSATQNTNSPPGNQRVDEVPVVPTKAKLNQVLTRSTNEFGMESMFQSTRQRQNLADEDAPPTSSVNDIPNEIYVESKAPRFQPRNSTIPEGSQLGRRQPKLLNSSTSSASSPLYIIVFGYPPDKYSVTVEYFKSLGNSTEADPNTEVGNCFKIGYNDPADAMRAVRKNGEVLGGSWMIGAKWADATQAEALVGQANLRSSTFGDAVTSSVKDSNAMAVDEPTAPFSPSHHVDTPTVGTPIRLEPSTSAFRKPGVGGAKPQSVSTSAWGTPSALAGNPSTPANKGVLGQVSDLIFGW